MTSFNRRAAVAGLGAALLARPAFAHRLARTETDVRIADDGSVSVIHAYHLQDAQDALYGAGLIDTPDLGSLRNRAKLALYTAEHFGLSVDGEAIALETVGAEVEGSTVFVYQEANGVDDGSVTIHARMLRKLVAKQQNSVNVTRGGQTVTLDFRGDDGVKTVR